MLLRAFAILLTLVLLGGCDDRFPDYRYKMTIYVDTPEGEKAFSSVRQVRVEQVRSIADSAGVREKVTLEGEAVILDLPGRTVYALLSKPDNSDYAAYIASAALGPYVAPDPRLSEAEQELRDEAAARHPNPRAYLDEAASGLQKMVKVKGPKNLPRTLPNHDPYRGPREIDEWPMFVGFSDPSDPSTVYQVSPDEIGVKRITIEITHDTVTDLIDERLPKSFWQKWVEHHRAEIRKPGGAMNNPYFDILQGHLSRDAFKSGGK